MLAATSAGFIQFKVAMTNAIQMLRKLSKYTDYKSYKQSNWYYTRFRMRRTGSIEIEGVGRGFSEKVKLHDADVFCTSRNTWSLRCHKEQLAKMKNHEEFSNSILFIHPWYAAVCFLIRNLHQDFRISFCFLTAISFISLVFKSK